MEAQESTEIKFTMLSDRSVRFENIPVGNLGDYIAVVMRPLTRRDRDFVASLEGDPFAEEKLLALLITKWGNQPGVTSLELMEETCEEAVIVLGQAYQKFFRRNYRFVELPSPGVAASRVPPKREVVPEPERVAVRPTMGN